MIIEGKQAIWKEYQKQIADDKYFYVRSCVRQNFFPGSETTFLRIMRDELGKDVYEHPCHTTCTGIGYHGDIVPVDTMMTVVARQFALMTEAGYENLAPSCITSFGIYTEVLDTWHHFPEVEEKVRKYLKQATGREFKIPKNLAHASDIVYKFRKEIALKSKFKLVDKETGKPLKVVDHIGCHYAKMFPEAGIGGAEYPYQLIGMIEEWGGEVIDYPERRHCCGFGFRQYLVQANRGYSMSCSHKKFESMEPYEPDMILTNCPGCPMFLDKWQYAIAEMEGKTYGKNGQGIPVFTYEELAGLVLGYNPWDLGLQVHQVSCEPLMDKIGIPYDPSKKYADKNGVTLGIPEKPGVLKVS
ncbi:MAG: heterodisulfide reductase-related iron-sulfur binding cluster [Bacteroidales bacterium]|jgi:heterodisulfide reductase subunit B